MHRFICIICNFYVGAPSISLYISDDVVLCLFYILFTCLCFVCNSLSHSIYTLFGWSFFNLFSPHPISKLAKKSNDRNETVFFFKRTFSRLHRWVFSANGNEFIQGTFAPYATSGSFRTRRHEFCFREAFQHIWIAHVLCEGCFAWQLPKQLNRPAQHI